MHVYGYMDGPLEREEKFRGALKSGWGAISRNPKTTFAVAGGAAAAGTGIWMMADPKSGEKIGAPPVISAAASVDCLGGF
jgi:hypothetical protein